VNKPFLGGVVVALAVLVGAGAFLLAPRLQSPKDQVFAKTNERAERARRLLHEFSQNQERIAALTGALAQSGVSVAPDDVEALLENNREMVEQEDRRLHDTMRQGAGERRELQERLLELAPGEQDQQPHRVRIGTNDTQMRRSLSEGLRERDRLATENKSLLRDALDEVNQALGESVGDTSGQDDIQANRLLGVVLYYVAQSKHLQANLVRQEAAQFRSELASLGLGMRSLSNETSLLADSGIAAAIAEGERNVAEAESRLAKLQASADSVQSEIDETQSRIAKARAAADESRVAMENMEMHGVDLSDSDGFKAFADEFNHLALTHRQALSEVHRLEFGTLRNARIDSSGDFIKGRYVPAEDGGTVEVDRGLAGLASDLSEVQLEVAGAEHAVASAGAFRDGLLARRVACEEQGARAAVRLEELTNAASKAYTEFSRLTGEAEDQEDVAIDHYVRSARAFSKAARLARTRAGDAGSAIASLSPEARERSAASKIADDAWLEKQYNVNAAEVQIELGRLYYVISEESERTAEVLAALPPDRGSQDADPAAWREKRDQARTEGLDVLHTAYDALQRTRRIPQGEWTLAAEAAAAANLLALLGEGDARDVIGLYRQVVQGHEDKPHMQAYVNRLRVLDAD